MKSKVFLLMLAALLVPCIACADIMCNRNDDCVRLYIATGHNIGAIGDDYQGIKFPVYLGYFTINTKQNRLYFTGKMPDEFQDWLKPYKAIIESSVVDITVRGLPDGNLEKYLAKELVEQLRNDKYFRPNRWNLTFLLERAGKFKVLGYSEDSTGVDPETVNVQFFKQCTYLPNNDPPEKCNKKEENAFFMMVPNLKITPYEVDINRYKRYLETGEID